MLCTDEAPLQPMCLSLVMATVGTDYNQLNTVSEVKKISFVFNTSTRS